MDHLWSPRPRIFYVFLGIFVSAGLLAGNPIHGLSFLHSAWGLRLLALAMLASAFGMMHWKSGTPTCFALEAYPFQQESRTMPPNLLSLEHPGRGGESVSPWTIFKWSALGTLVGQTAQAMTIRRDPPFPDDAGPAPNVEAWPEWSQNSILRPEGRLAHWDPWRNHMIVGQGWRATGWLELHVVAHEFAHAAQPQKRLRWAGSWIKGVLVASAISGFLIPSGVWGPLIAAIAVSVGDAFLRWPMEAMADKIAGDRLVRLSTPHAQPAVRQWGRRITYRHQRALAMETISWAALASALAVFLPALFFGHLTE